MNPKTPPGPLLRTTTTAILLACLCLPAIVLATPVAPSASEALAGQRAIGQTLFRWFGLEVYRATLYGGEAFSAAEFSRQRLALELEYRRSFSGNDIAKRSIDEMRAQTPLAPASERDWLAAMNGLFPDVKQGDRLLGVHEPGVGASFYLNGRVLGRVDDADFSARFFGIWLSPRTSQPKMRAALIAGAAP
jgi:hypothetical protein